jgi:hypothetical protein
VPISRLYRIKFFFGIYRSAFQHIPFGIFFLGGEWCRQVGATGLPFLKRRLPAAGSAKESDVYCRILGKTGAGDFLPIPPPEGSPSVP